MYDDSWFGYVPESRKEESTSSKHRRKESLLKQPNGNSQIPDPAETVLEIFQKDVGLKGPPQATSVRRAKSYSDFYDAAATYLSTDDVQKPKDVLEILGHGEGQAPFGVHYGEYEDNLLDASQDEYLLYRDQLALSERHLDSLLENTTSALDLLAKISDSFKAVDSQTTAFQAQCEDLVAEQKRLRDLADEIGSDIQYSAYPPIRTRLRDTFLPFRLNNIISLQPPPS